MVIVPPLAVILVVMAGGTATAASWHGVVKIEGMIHEPSCYHPYVATISLRLREGDRVAVPGGSRVPLVSEGSVNAVRTSVHQESGLMLCSGSGTETLPEQRIGYLEMNGQGTTYHLAVPRAFGAFACGQNRAIRRNRLVLIGTGDAEAAEIETADSAPRAVERGGSLMQGSYESNAKRGLVRYEYKISWSLERDQAPITRIDGRR